LVDPEFYFTKASSTIVPEELLTVVSDSEQTLIQSASEIQSKLQA
jgi:hypothetical protein